MSSSAPIATAPAKPTTAPIAHPPVVDQGRAWALLLLRAWIGLRAAVSGIEKFAGTRSVERPLLDEFGAPDISGAMVVVQEKVYSVSHYQAMPDLLREQLAQEPLMPGFMLSAFSAALGPLLILFGLGTLLGVFTRISLFGLGLIFSALTVGLVLLKQDGGVAWLAIHIVLIAYALSLLPHNRFALTRS
jgi:thiosulfate dehydrogenase (quinone) large subunit